VSTVHRELPTAQRHCLAGGGSGANWYRVVIFGRIDQSQMGHHAGRG
jgi:hypothetical protein